MRIIRAVLLGVPLCMLGMACPPPAYADVPGIETIANSGSVAANSVSGFSTSCSSGKAALGGGVEVPPSGVVQIIASEPIGANGNDSTNAWGWSGQFKNTDSTAHTVYVWVVCATVGS
jgi:hypothetical protein